MWQDRSRRAVSHDVANNLGVNDLANDSFVRNANNKSVPRGCKLVVVLDNHPPSGKVVCLALPPAPVFDLVTLEVSIVLENFDEAHVDEKSTIVALT